MNARIARLAFSLCSLTLLNFPGSLRAQDTNSAGVPRPPGYANGVPQPPGYYNDGSMGNAEGVSVFNIQIENGKLSLQPIKGRAEIKNPWDANAAAVPATIDNLTKYLRAVDTNLNIILSPEAGALTIDNLKLSTRDLRTISGAISVASGGVIRGNIGGGGGGGFGGSSRNAERNLTFASSNSESKNIVEVFNLSGYVQTAGKAADDGVINEKLEVLESMILTTLATLHPNQSSTDRPHFKYHPGTKLFIVIGKPDALEVTRKIVNALSGQQPNARTDLLLDTPPPAEQK